MAEAVGVGLIGLGTVGTAVARRLLDEWELLTRRAGATPVLRCVAVRDARRGREVDLRTARLQTDPEALVDDPAVTVVVEVMGGVDRASSLIERALTLAKPVVTANKAAMAAHGVELSRLAADRGTSLRYEAAVGAAIPVVAMLRDSFGGDRVGGLEMIINGTTNFILGRMESGRLDFATALAEAQERGFAEADPSSDVDGHDSAAKLVLLSRLAFGAPLGLADVDTAGIAGVDRVDIACAASMDASLKLVALGRLARDGVTLSVRPTMVVAGHPLHGVDGSENAVVINADLAGTVTVRGSGAGGDPTASAVVGDIVQAVRCPGVAPPVPVAEIEVRDGSEVERGSYLRVRLAPLDEADRLVTQALGDRGLPVRAATMVPGPDGSAAELAVLTATVPRQMRDRAVETLESLPSVAAVVTVMDACGTDP